MKRFELITELDARRLERGECVSLAANGIITPLARETLTARHVVVVHEGRSGEDDVALAPVTEVRTLMVGSDHEGIGLKKRLVPFLRARGLSVHDLSADDSSGTVEYPEVAAAIAHAVARREADAGIVIDASGAGSAIVANKVPGIRAASCTSEALARYVREQIGINVLVLGASLLAPADAEAVVLAWLTTPFRPLPSIRLLATLRDLEEEGRPR